MPFTGRVKRVRNLAFPLRHKRRAGVYYWTVPAPTEPQEGITFYMDESGTAPHGPAPFVLRLEDANEHLSGRLAFISGYYCDYEGEGDTMQPIIARLPRGRGFLAGWTMGPGMIAHLSGNVFDSEQGAALAAHNEAERAAERGREYNANWRGDD